jgi:long-chain acyl-CoA synthetase
MTTPLALEQTVIDLLDQAVARYPDHPAFTGFGRTVTYRQLDGLSRRFTAWLQRHTALRPGDRIAIQLPNLVHYPLVAYGALRAGLVVVNTNPLYTPPEVARQLNESGAAMLVVMGAMAERSHETIRDTAVIDLLLIDPIDFHLDLLEQAEPAAPMVAEPTPRVCTLRDALAEAGSEPAATVALTPASLALLQYTGGTTGVAKGAMLSHSNLVANTEQLRLHSGEYFRPGEECYVAALPLYHIYAFLIHLIALPTFGGHSLLIPDPRNIPALVEAIRPHRFTGFPGINTLFNALCANEAFSELDFTSLRSTSAGGMALTPETAAQWQQLTGITIAEGYGMSETSPVISPNPPGRIQTGTIGLPLPHTEVKVVDGDGRELPAGERGELWVRGPQVMLGYWQRPEETAAVLSADGWLRTGDVAVIEPDGYIRLVDRIKDVIVVSGFNVYPTEVESVARLYAGVRECAAVAMPSAQSGETVKLYVVVSGEVDGAALRSFMREHLAPYKIPTQIEQIDELPKNNVGKVLRRELLDRPPNMDRLLVNVSNGDLNRRSPA